LNETIQRQSSYQACGKAVDNGVSHHIGQNDTVWGPFRKKRIFYPICQIINL